MTLVPILNPSAKSFPLAYWECVSWSFGEMPMSGSCTCSSVPRLSLCWRRRRACPSARPAVLILCPLIHEGIY